MCVTKYLLLTYVHHTGHRIICTCIIIYLFVIFNGIIVKLCLKLLLCRYILGIVWNFSIIIMVIVSHYSANESSKISYITHSVFIKIFVEIYLKIFIKC